MTQPAGFLTVTAEEYHADPAEQPSLSSTLARKLIDESPLHAWTEHPKLNPNYAAKPSKREFDIGTACHALLLEGRNAVSVVHADSWRSNDAKEMRDNAYAAGKVPLLAREWDTVQEMCENVRNQIANLGLLTDGKSEQTLIWHAQDTVCRARVDHLRDDFTLVQDIKTTSRSANPEKFSKTLYDLGYHIQAEFYCRGVETLTGIRPDFQLIVCETKQPYAVTVHSLSPAGWALAGSQVNYALDLWARCIESGVWPGYSSEVAYAEPPGWAEAQWLEREAREGIAA